MRTDIIDCGCEDLPEGAPVDHHITIRIAAGHGRILRLDIDSPPNSSRTNRQHPRPTGDPAMTVQELIDALSTYAPDANVKVWGTANAGTVDCELHPDIYTHEDQPVLVIRVPEKLTWRCHCSGLCWH